MRLYLPSSASGSITFRFLDAGANQIGADYSVSGLWSDGQVVGTSNPAPSNVDRVQITFTQVAVAPGLRTVSVFSPPSALVTHGGRS